MEQQEFMIQLQMLQQEAEALDQQVQIIEQQTAEMNAVKVSLDELSDEKKTGMKTILANLGKGIFIEAEVKNKELFVNVGKDVLVKKTPKQTIIIVEEQLKKLEAGKASIIERIEEIQVSMQTLVQEVQKNVGNNHNHQHAHAHSCENEDCKCEEPCDDCKCGHEQKHSKKR